MKNNILILIGITIIVIGRKIFHLSFINISYRKRGYVPRTHSRMIVIKINSSQLLKYIRLEKNMSIVIILKIIILIYSARKIRANQPPMYSTLNPDTNSDSPSAKSNGLRLVSAKHVITHKVKITIFPQKKYRIF